MIHTLTMYFAVKATSIDYFFSRYNIRLDKMDYIEAAVKKVNDQLKINHPGYIITYLKWLNDDQWRIHLKLDLTKILDKGSITEGDYARVVEEIQNFLKSQLDDASYYETHVLTRIDYKYDVKLSDKNEKELLLHLFEKYTQRYRHKMKIKWGIDEHGDPFKYDTSQYHKNKSVELIMYDKEEERKANNEPVLVYEKDVFRYELRLKNDHLNSRKRNGDKGKGIEKTLENYFKYDVWYECMTKHIYPIVRKGDYYKIFEAEKIIESSSYSRLKKKKLRAFLVTISQGNIDTPKKSMSTPTYRNYLKSVESLGINPILIPKNRKDSPGFLKNPFDL